MEEQDFTSQFVGGYQERTETVDEVTGSPLLPITPTLNHHNALVTSQTAWPRRAWDALARPGSLEASPRFHATVPGEPRGRQPRGCWGLRAGAQPGGERDGRLRPPLRRPPPCSQPLAVAPSPRPDACSPSASLRAGHLRRRRIFLLLLPRLFRFWRERLQPPSLRIPGLGNTFSFLRAPRVPPLLPYSLDLGPRAGRPARAPSRPRKVGE